MKMKWHLKVIRAISKSQTLESLEINPTRQFFHVTVK